MDRISLITLLLLFSAATVTLSPPRAHAAPPENAAAVSPTDDATRKKVDQKASNLVDPLKLSDPPKAVKIKAKTGEWIGAMLAWHKEHDPELGRLWGEWNKARAVVP